MALTEEFYKRAAEASCSPLEQEPIPGSSSRAARVALVHHGATDS